MCLAVVHVSVCSAPRVCVKLRNQLAMPCSIEEAWVCLLHTVSWSKKSGDRSMPFSFIVLQRTAALSSFIDKVGSSQTFYF